MMPQNIQIPIANQPVQPQFYQVIQTESPNTCEKCSKFFTGSPNVPIMVFTILMTSFDIVEFYLKLSKQFDKTKFSQKITNGDFYFSIFWDGFSLANHYIDLTEKADPENYQNAKCFGKDKTIKDVIKENEETILRNTPIKLKNLDPFFVALVKRYKSKEIQKTYKKEA